MGSWYQHQSLMQMENLSPRCMVSPQRLLVSAKVARKWRRKSHIVQKSVKCSHGCISLGKTSHCARITCVHWIGGMKQHQRCCRLFLMSYSICCVPKFISRTLLKVRQFIRRYHVALFMRICSEITLCLLASA